MDEVMTTKEAAEKWNISVRQVQNYCKKKIIPDVIKIGTNYLIPRNASKPIYGYYNADKSVDEETNTSTRK